MKDSSFRLLTGLLIPIFALGIVFGIGAMTVNEEGAANAATTMGFSQVEVQDSGFMFSSFRGCDGKDFSWYKVHAVNSNNQEVDLRVCRGLFKGYTVRVD